MQAVWAVTVPSVLGPIARFVTDLDPVRVRFTVAGQANAIVLNPRFDVFEHRVLVMNPEVSHWDWIFAATYRKPEEMMIDGVAAATRRSTTAGTWRLKSISSSKRGPIEPPRT